MTGHASNPTRSTTRSTATATRTLALDAGIALAYALAVGLAALISFRLPFTPVPVTGQTFAVLAGGLLIGWRRAVPGIALYAALGLAGLPWFAGGAHGPQYLLAPSFGYIVGFAAAAALVGALTARGFDRHPALVLIAMVAGSLVIYLVGATWLALALHVGPATAIALGVTPFLLGDALKALVAAGAVPLASRARPRR